MTDTQLHPYEPKTCMNKREIPVPEEHSPVNHDGNLAFITIFTILNIFIFFFASYGITHLAKKIASSSSIGAFRSKPFVVVAMLMISLFVFYGVILILSHGAVYLKNKLLPPFVLIPSVLIFVFIVFFIVLLSNSTFGHYVMKPLFRLFNVQSLFGKKFWHIDSEDILTIWSSFYFISIFLTFTLFLIFLNNSIVLRNGTPLKQDNNNI